MTYIIYLVVCCAIMLSFIFYGIKTQRKKQKAFFQQETDESLPDLPPDNAQ
jgi:hypothetical protein